MSRGDATYASAVAARWARVPLEARLDRLYDDAAAFIGEGGGMTWSEFWNTPTNRLGRYARAIDRRNEKRREELERERRR